MNPSTEPPSGEPRRLPGLYRRWELTEVLEQHGNCQIEDAGAHADGTPLVAVFFTEPLSGSLADHLTGGGLNRLLHVPVGEIAALPAAELASLQRKSDASFRSAKAVADWINGALDIRYGTRARQLRAAQDRDTGAIRFEDNGFTVVADLPKRVKWDQQRLGELVELIRSGWGENPAHYVKVKFEVSERAYESWPVRLKDLFTPARTVETGKPSYELLPGREAGMSLRLVTAAMRLSTAIARTTLCVLAPSGSGKTSLMKALPGKDTLCLDFEAGLMSVQDWDGDSIPIRSFEDARDIACLIGGVNPAADPNGYYSEGHHAHVVKTYPDLAELVAAKRYVFVDSLTDLTRQAMAWAKQQPEAYSERTGKPDIRGAYGLLAREVITLLKHLQHAEGRTTIFVGILEQLTDEFGRTTWQPQLEGGKVARELPGIVDQVATLSLFEPEGDGWRHDPAKGRTRRLVCQTVNPFSLPAKDRSGRLAVTEPADLAALLSKIHAPRKG